MLVAGSLKVVGDESSVQVQALVTTIGDGTVTVTVNGTPLTIPVPPGIQLDPSLVGQTISLTLDLSGDDAEAVEADDQGEPNDQAGDANDQADANDNEQADDNDQADESGDSTEAGDDGQSAGDQSGSGDQGNNAGDDGGDNGGGDDGGGD